jgi:hypothetical protein
MSLPEKPYSHHKGVSMLRSLSLLFSLLALACTFANQGLASVITVPTGLSPGDHYYLTFVTAGARGASSNHLPDYDLFVNQQADLSTPKVARITWTALASISSVSAYSWLSLGEYPIYRLDGVLVATGGSDLWDGDIAVPINVDQYGVQGEPTFTWTGTSPAGLSMHNTSLGDPSYRSENGYTGSTGIGWVRIGDGMQSLHLPFYAFSSLQTVPPVPEPTSLSIVCVGAALLFVVRNRRRFVGRSQKQRVANTAH